jgi:nucleotide-binding universal stress UspA family protein
MRVTIEKKTDQLNFEDFLGGVTRIVTVAGVKAGTKEQQYDIAIEGDQRVWRPAVTVLKILVAAWGDDAAEWVGRRAELYGDPTVTFGRDTVGGIRVSRLSHLDGPLSVKLTETHTVDPLPDTPTNPAAPLLAQIKTAAERAGVDLATVAAEWAETHEGQPIGEATDLGGLELLADDLRGRAS